MRVIIITQARMGSTRLPGKVLMGAAGRTLLAHQIDRLLRIPSAQGIVVATTEATADDPIEDQARKLGVDVFRGSETDVLARYQGAALASGAQVVVRVTSDCPLIDPDVSERVIRRFLVAAGALDYVSNTLTRTYPRGLDTEVFSFHALDLAYHEAVLPQEREHVTPFLYTHPERFRLAQVTDTEDRSGQRWTVDTPEDLELVRRVLEAVYPIHPHFTMHDILDVLAIHPDWLAINAMMEQKRLLP